MNGREGECANACDAVIPNAERLLNRPVYIHTSGKAASLACCSRPSRSKAEFSELLQSFRFAPAEAGALSLRLRYARLPVTLRYRTGSPFAVRE